jgi:hypothetical protein
MTTRAIYENLRIIEVPIPYAERLGRSKLSVVRDGFRFTNAIVWTALAYNPARILGLVSVTLLALAGILALYIIGLRISGVTEFSPWQLYLLFAGVVGALVGISLFALGAMFNYLVTLFHKRPVRQGLFGKPLFDPPLDRHFGWIGLVAVALGICISLVALGLGLGGWGITRLWFYLLISALLILIGIQLLISWILMRTLEELALRETETRRDLDLEQPEAGQTTLDRLQPNSSLPLPN